MQRISDINGKYHDRGLFNDNIIEAYLKLVEVAHSSHVKIACSSASVRLLERDFPDVLRQLRYDSSRRNAGSFGDHKWIFFIFHVAGGNGHWVALGINTQNKSYTYYDYAKMNTNRSECMSATREFLQYTDSLTSNTEPWTEYLEGTQDMEQQLNGIDCGPGTCLLIEAIIQDIPLSSLSRATITQGRQHIAACLLTQQIVGFQSMLVTTATSTTSTSPLPYHTPILHASDWTSTALPTELTRSAVTSLPSLHMQPSHVDPFIYPYANTTRPTLDIPALTADMQHTIDECIASAPVYDGDVSLDPLLDIQDLIQPACIAHTVIDRILHSILQNREDVTYIPIALTLAISAFPDNLEAAAAFISQQDWTRLQTTLLLTRYTVIGLFTTDPHFVGAILDLHPPDAALPKFYFLDSLLHDTYATRLLRITQSIFHHVMTNNPTVHEPSLWTVDSTATGLMTPQQPFTPPGHSPSNSTHIECGVYLIMMVQMWLANHPLSAITPISVQQYRPHLAYFVLACRLLRLLSEGSP